MDDNKVSLSALLNDRRVIPRWKTPEQAVEISKAPSNESIALQSRSEKWLSHLKFNFEQFPSEFSAQELYETALVLGRESDISPKALKLSAARRISVGQEIGRARKKQEEATRETLSAGVELGSHYEHAARQIRYLRQQLAERPERPLAWSELARHYLTVGQDKKAIQAMQAARHLSERNRYLCRAAARLFVHVRDVEQAVALLRANPATKNDPWLLAAEVATSSVIRKKSIYIDRARAILASGNFAPSQISELAAAVGTLELVNGSAKKAKALFAQSLLDPTENSVAQAQWAVAQNANVKIVIPAMAWTNPETHEARALAERAARNWSGSLAACARWLAEEPYSIRPAIMGSYLGFRPEHSSMAEQFSSAGLKTEPHNPLLLNNRAVARAQLGRLSDAYVDIKQALHHQDARQDAHILATLGLISYRAGLIDLGREYYGQSVAWFVHVKSRTSAAAAALHWVYEESLIDPTCEPIARKLAEKIMKSATASREPEVMGMVELVLESIKTKNSRSPIALPTSGLYFTSIDEIKSQASLLVVPKRAKQLALNFLPDSDFD